MPPKKRKTDDAVEPVIPSDPGRIIYNDGTTQGIDFVPSYYETQPHIRKNVCKQILRFNYPTRMFFVFMYACRNPTLEFADIYTAQVKQIVLKFLSVYLPHCSNKIESFFILKQSSVEVHLVLNEIFVKSIEDLIVFEKIIDIHWFQCGKNGYCAGYEFYRCVDEPNLFGTLRTAHTTAPKESLTKCILQDPAFANQKLETVYLPPMNLDFIEIEVGRVKVKMYNIMPLYVPVKLYVPITKIIKYNIEHEPGITKRRYVKQEQSNVFVNILEKHNRMMWVDKNSLKHLKISDTSIDVYRERMQNKVSILEFFGTVKPKGTLTFYAQANETNEGHNMFDVQHEIETQTEDVTKINESESDSDFEALLSLSQQKVVRK